MGGMMQYKTMTHFLLVHILLIQEMDKYPHLISHGHNHQNTDK